MWTAGTRVGTCSWTDPALVAAGWYPPAARDPEGRLRHYAARFPVVEVDSTYYALPSARNSALWAERTPPGFLFDVKVFSLLTGHPTRVSALPADLRPPGPPGRVLRPDEVSAELRREVWQRFTAALAPLADAGRLGSVLLQFPPWFGPADDTRAALLRWRERAGALRLAVEFRDPAWLRPDAFPRTAALLRDLGAACVAVDTAPGLPSSLPPVTAVTCPALAVVRLHGRSRLWGTGSKEDRFRHRYTAAELRPWVGRVRELADRAADVHVLFNNCCGDAAVSGAELMTRLLPAPGARPPH
ncbi:MULTISPECIES: DUF72 domain-containing protein [unclassified Streptomyces]|uniref:DUF72 domain-containing protein n=1 Tax=unclassified Streptomyces TaxID=2593676 RepID=UPI000B8345CA|nr:MULTISPECIES: DUF72 domain-containing protein [unclassified Streptomyces]MYS24876.1 DUF72 domain-containing protein [Streptomyces sp. SID4948]